MIPLEIGTLLFDNAELVDSLRFDGSNETN